MRAIPLVLATATCFAMTSAPMATAQDDVDVEAVAETVLAADQVALMTALETPIADEDLPQGFSNATFVDPETASAEEGVLPASDLEGAEGSVAYAIDFDPAALAATATPGSGSAEASFSIGLASLNYIFMGDEIMADDLEEFKSGAREGLADETGDAASPEAGAAGMEATVEDIEVAGVEGALITYRISEEGIQSVVQMVAIPVGNTMVISMAVEAGTEVDTDAVLAASQDLALAGADYLGAVAEDAR